MDTKIIDRAWDLAHAFELKTIRRVRTPAGQRRFGQPIGSIIVRDAVLDKIKILEPEYDGWDRVEGPGGKVYDVGWDSDKDQWIATEEGDWDAVVATADNEEDVFKNLNEKLGGKAKVKPNTRAVRKGKKLTSNIPKGFEASVIKDDEGRESIRGKDADGKNFRGYRTAGNEWIAYYPDEQGWSKSRMPSRTPAAAIRRMAEDNDTIKKGKQNTGTFNQGSNSANSSNPKKPSGDRKPASSIAKIGIRLGNPVDAFNFTSERRDRLQGEWDRWIQSASDMELVELLAKLKPYANSGALTQRERATAKQKEKEVRKAIDDLRKGKKSLIFDRIEGVLAK